jgi:hypothetical protein
MFRINLVANILFEELIASRNIGRCEIIVSAQNGSQVNCPVREEKYIILMRQPDIDGTKASHKAAFL